MATHSILQFVKVLFMLDKAISLPEVNLKVLLTLFDIKYD